MPITLNGTTGIQQPAALLAGSTSGVVTLQGAANAGTWTMTLPTTAGAPAQLLQTDGAGVTNWGLSPTTAGNVLFTADGVNWSSTQKIARPTITAPNATGQTTVEFKSLPSWLKKITVQISNLRCGTSTTPIYIHLGTGATPTWTTSGYTGVATSILNPPAPITFTNGFGIANNPATTGTFNGAYTITNITGTSWVMSGSSARGDTPVLYASAGQVDIGAALTAVRVYLDGTQTFQSGTVNILYE